MDKFIKYSIDQQNKLCVAELLICIIHVQY